MAVFTEHPEYTKAKWKWEIVRDVISDNVKKHVIPPLSLGSSNRISKRNQRYIDMAIFHNFTINTRLGLVGIALQKDGVIELPPELEYMRKQATGNKLKLDQLARIVLGEVAEVGRCVLYTDYPHIPTGLDAATTKILNPHARIYVRKAEELINWGIDKTTGEDVLELAILKEVVPQRLSDFTWIDFFQYRVFQLDENGDYYQYIMDREHNLLMEPFYPLQNGKKMKAIPLDIVGAEDNDITIDNSPLYPIAHVNIGHYRNSANLEDNCDAHGQGTLAYTSSLNPSQITEMTKTRPMIMGSREGYYLGETGALTLTQLQPNQLAADMMTQKENQMVMMGAHLIMPSHAKQPVETTRMQLGAKLSRLDTMVTNTEDAIEHQLQNCALFEGGNPNLVKYQLNHEFIPESADPLLVQQIAAGWQMGALPQSVYLDYMRTVGFIPRDITNEQIINEIEQQSPIGAGTGFGAKTPKGAKQTKPDASAPDYNKGVQPPDNKPGDLQRAGVIIKDNTGL